MQALTLLLALVVAYGSTMPAEGRPVSDAPAQSSRMRDERVQSAALGRSVPYRVLLPADYGQQARRYPVLYLLHGLTGGYTDWSTRTRLVEYTRTQPLIIVMPDAGNSWYTNAAGDPSAKFEDFVLADLVADVEKKFDAIASRDARAIAGLSMGGYGAVKMALKRPAQFVFAGSFSGAMPAGHDPEYGRQFGTEFVRMQAIFGPPGSETRRDNDVYALAEAVPPSTAPYVYFDCGTSDGLLESNRRLAAVLQKGGVRYEYHEVPGAHSWAYWDARVRVMVDVLMRHLRAAP